MSSVLLDKKVDQVYAIIDNSEPVPVTVVWARPATGVGREISVFSDEKEVAFLKSIDELDENSRKIAHEELSVRYFAPKIIRILKTEVHLGNRYFDVLTDCGFKSFIIKNPYVDIRAIEEDGALISDVMGNLYLIPSISSLDKKSRSEIDKVI